MQFTGLRDINDKDIYEGDIVKCDMIYSGSGLPHMGEIVYDECFGAFATRNKGGVTLLHNHFLNTFEIVGNIYGKPELMNELRCEDYMHVTTSEKLEKAEADVYEQETGKEANT